MLSLQDLLIIQMHSFLGPVVMSNEARSLHALRSLGAVGPPYLEVPLAQVVPPPSLGFLLHLVLFRPLAARLVGVTATLQCIGGAAPSFINLGHFCSMSRKLHGSEGLGFTVLVQLVGALRVSCASANT